MPNYEYRCDECGREEVLLVNSADRSGQTCGCGGKLRIVFKTAPFGIIRPEGYAPPPEPKQTTKKKGGYIRTKDGVIPTERDAREMLMRRNQAPMNRELFAPPKTRSQEITARNIRKRMDEAYTKLFRHEVRA
jgi:putative FmdB family regulatory protein